MIKNIVVLVSGEVLADEHNASMLDQKRNCQKFAEALTLLLTSDMKMVIMYGNKPQVGYVLYRSEIASNSLHSVPLDVCGADTQGATGYLLSQAIMNVLRKGNTPRNVISTITQTLVDNNDIHGKHEVRAIGPCYDRDRAEKYRDMRGWQIIEEVGRGYRRAVPALPPIDIIEMDGITQLVNSGIIVIAGGGGGVPVTVDTDGKLMGVEAVVDVEKIASMFAMQLGAEIMLLVIKAATKYIMARLCIEKRSHISLAELDSFLENEDIKSRTIKEQLMSASKFLHNGGTQVIITTLEKLQATLNNSSGLWIGDTKMRI